MLYFSFEHDLFGKPRYPPRYPSAGQAFFPDHALDAERAAQIVATPESVSLVFAPNSGAY
jgi:hypothetical protein